MTIALDPELEAAVRELARREGVAPEAAVLNVLRDHVLPRVAVVVAQDEWERHLLALTRDCGVSLPDSAVSREEMYE
jgi:hypothetical protein